MKKVLALILAVLLIACTCVGCTEAERVNQNINKQADNFNVTRRLAVINARTDKPVFECIGNFSLSNSAYNELVVTVEVGEGQYKKHYIYLNEWTIYTVEDVSGAFVSKYHYEVNYLPEMFQLIEFTSYD